MPVSMFGFVAEVPVRLIAPLTEVMTLVLAVS